MESGFHPTHDHEGNPIQGHRAGRIGQKLASGWCASCVGTQSDIKEKVKVNRYTRNWQANFFCERCLACRHIPHSSGYDFSDMATWRHMITTHPMYLATTPEWLRSPWCQLRSWTIFRQRDDLLHVCWLGFGKDVAGQLLYDLACRTGGGLGQNLGALYREMKEWFRGRGVPCNVRPFS